MVGEIGIRFLDMIRATKAAQKGDRFNIAAVMIGLGWPQLGLAQTPVPTQSIDPFGQEVNLTAKTIVYVAGSGTWDKAYDTLVEAFKKLDAYLDGAGLKASGPAMTIYTSTDDTGFDFKAAIPVAEAPKSPPGKEIAVGQSPDGKMLYYSSYKVNAIMMIPIHIPIQAN